MTQPVILCGGSGTRLWPLSRTSFPKQFLALIGDTSLFQQSLQRMQAISTQPAYVVGGEEHRFLIMEQLREIGALQCPILLEPSSKNTAAALTLAALKACDEEGDKILFVTPSDHIIHDQAIFTQAAQQAIGLAEAQKIALMGIPAHNANSAYGYLEIEKAAALEAGGIGHHFPLQRFIEKPEPSLAEYFVQQGNYYWNSGIFVLKASLWLELIQRFAPEIAASVQKSWRLATHDGPFTRPESASFNRITGRSIDYAVMEPLSDTVGTIHMVPLDAGWSDLGAWDAAYDINAQSGMVTKDGNACIGDTLMQNCKNSLLHASDRLVVAIGMEDTIIVETADAVLVTKRDQAQHVKQLVERLQAQGRKEQNFHRKVHRPWGWYDNLDEGPGFKIKRIQVNVGASLSLQKHEHRAEHWVILGGCAEVFLTGNTYILQEDESIDIPKGAIHRLTNAGESLLELIEIQTGHYLEEDDIIRLDDDYARQKQ